jgi:hypothetical protein
VYQLKVGVGSPEFEETLAEGITVPHCSDPVVEGFAGIGFTVTATVGVLLQPNALVTVA